MEGRWCIGVNDLWIPIKDGDQRAFGLYRRHYSAPTKRGGVRLRQFVGPRESLVLLTPEQNALFVWLRDKPGTRRDRQEGLNCSVFRNEGDRLSSDLILAAEDMAFEKWGRQRLFTYVNAGKIRSSNPGYCFKVAGWRRAGVSKNGLILMEKYGCTAITSSNTTGST